MATLLKSVDLKKGLPPNRRAIAAVFVIVGVLSAVFWLQGRATEDPEMIDASNAVSQKGSWLQPLEISYVAKGREDRDTARQTTKLISEIQEKLKVAIGEYGIYVYRLDENQGYGLREEEVMPAASIMKVPIMIATYRAIADGSLKDSPQIQGMLTAMGKRSDNEASKALINQVGRPKMHEALEILGMTNSDFDANATTALDVAEMWRRIYSGDLINAEHKEKLWTDLQDSIFEERIPAGVSDDVDVVHKVGTDIDIWADSGIVLAEQPLVIVMLNKGVNQPQAKDLVPQIVSMIWDMESARTSD